MKYKLKDFVTDEMLVECGFEIKRSTPSNATRKIQNEASYIYIGFSETSAFSFGMRYVEFGNSERDDEDITPYIQDLIEKGYVEIVKWKSMVI